MNKADSLDPTELLKISSALTWQLSRILRAPEVRRIYVGSLCLITDKDYYFVITVRLQVRRIYVGSFWDEP